MNTELQGDRDNSFYIKRNSNPNGKKMDGYIPVIYGCAVLQAAKLTKNFIIGNMAISTMYTVPEFFLFSFNSWCLVCRINYCLLLSLQLVSQRRF